ncbi:hypothetical protein BCR43DRAFT_488865 [Syncephalastrum racemosum]|uniref:Uncharacterized protein n=1 Tax=Syncephalastrum racemosum TaxID=13706 RepID=A0A1X2HJD4_SYNRA|nr:hypothetical protein BCR43DRAFT_488865 [Syncephalastrum racemosum]
MTILGNSLPLFGSLFSKQTDRRLCKQVGSISTVIRQQQQQTFSSTSSARAHPSVKSADFRSHYNNTNSNSHANGETVTEGNILSAFPRPNLNPTLHFSLFGLQNSPPQQDSRSTAAQCSNCAGPHSTDFCPC